MSKPLHLKTTLQIFGFNEDLDSVSLIVMQETANLEKGEDNPLIRFSIDLPVDVMKHFFFDSLKKLITEGVSMKDVQDMSELSDIFMEYTKRNKKDKPN
jgi:hypothetical protein